MTDKPDRVVLSLTAADVAAAAPMKRESVVHPIPKSIEVMTMDPVYYY